MGTIINAKLRAAAIVFSSVFGCTHVFCFLRKARRSLVEANLPSEAAAARLVAVEPIFAVARLVARPIFTVAIAKLLCTRAKRSIFINWAACKRKKI